MRAAAGIPRRRNLLDVDGVDVTIGVDIPFGDVLLGQRNAGDEGR